MFKFNFNNDKPVSDNNSGMWLEVRNVSFVPTIVPLTGTEDDTIQWYQSREIKLSSDVADIKKKISECQVITLDYNCGLIMSCLSPKAVLTELKEKSDSEKEYDVLKADEKHLDLLPGVYEGGLKVWECTKDMVTHFIKSELKEGTNSLEKKLVLDLGCGSGILGIMCLLNGASVTFQDYNEEVLEAMTIPNIFLNCNNVNTSKINLYSGDWASFLNLIIDSKGDKFDYILTSETIYNPANYKKIIMIIKTLLKVDGTCFVGAKMNYFGVGGSLKEFQAHLEKEGMLGSLCWEATDGVARGILKVGFP